MGCRSRQARQHLGIKASPRLADHHGGAGPATTGGACSVAVTRRWFLDEVATTAWEEMHDGIVNLSKSGGATRPLQRVDGTSADRRSQKAKRQNLLRRTGLVAQRHPARTCAAKFGSGRQPTDRRRAATAHRGAGQAWRPLGRKRTSSTCSACGLCTSVATGPPECFAQYRSADQR